MKKIFNSPNFNIICAVSLKNNIIQGGALIPWNKNCGYYLYGGSINKPHAGSMNHLQWEIILKLKHLEVSHYDFVGARLNPKKGSKLEGIQRFKSRFGSELSLSYLWKYDYNKFKKLLYTTSFFLKSRKFQKDIVDEEIKLFLTFDYELFLRKSGSIYNCILKPTSLIIDKLQRNNIKAVFFIDILQMYMLRKKQSYR